MMRKPLPQDPLVPDLLLPGMKVVFCGTAPSRASAEAKAYYAHPGNIFWKTLHAIQLTPRLLAACDYPQLVTWKIGLTDLCKHHSGSDEELPTHGFDVHALEAKIQTYQPRILAFTSKNAARIALGSPAQYGLQLPMIGQTQVYVCCSTSGRARRFWQPHVWEELAKLVHLLN